MSVSALSRPTTLAEWIAATVPPGIPTMDATPVGSLRFLFYGRASTHEHQDPRTSRAWQLDVSRRLTGGHGRIVGEYVEVGCSRQVPWHLRPRAAAMLRYIATNAARVDAVVVGEYERAFLDTSQVRELRAVLERYGVQLWLPEAEGPVDFGNPAHEALLTLLAKRSLTEVLRSRHRVVTAMRMQTVEQGRYLGGRPPYGYRLVDASPHPNRALARRGVRQQRLVPNPATALVVKLIFTLRLAGHSAAGIARHLNEQAVPTPSSADAERDRRWVDAGWSRTRPEGAPGNLYLREDHLLSRIAAHLTAVGIADNPGPEHTARLVDELGLVFRCDTAGVALLDRGSTGPARAPRRRLAPQPVHSSPGTEHPGKAGEQLLLTVSCAPASEADQPDAPRGQIDAPAHRTRPTRQPLRRRIGPAAPQGRRRQTAFHVALGTTRSRNASRAGGAEYRLPGQHGGDRGRQVVGRAGRRPLLLPSHRQTSYEQRPSGRVEAGSGNTMPHETPS
ncbi:recombinase family protein [Saccharothrix sp. 6-C]|uniref:recombinase family protein n=1 Tax=Saccharothrix sp. 6-C TaxID=2781735 RepID=UPI0019179B26|nr:recombinase family protein [Saccharothrix sp. 6-C]QQQ80155.1 recombinase family protein [Saccharothrix sp. 6-C]